MSRILPFLFIGLFMSCQPKPATIVSELDTYFAKEFPLGEPGVLY